ISRGAAVVPTPIAVGLLICEKMIVEAGSNNISLINCFTQFRATTFPFRASPFHAIAFVTDAEGTGTIEWTLTRLETDEVIERWQGPGAFPDRFAVTRVTIRVAEWSFPAPGRYQLTLPIDGEWIAQRNLDVFQVEG